MTVKTDNYMDIVKNNYSTGYTQKVNFYIQKGTAYKPSAITDDLPGMTDSQAGIAYDLQGTTYKLPAITNNLPGMTDSQAGITYDLQGTAYKLPAITDD
jgi:hypothetical protein